MPELGYRLAEGHELIVGRPPAKASRIAILLQLLQVFKDAPPQIAHCLLHGATLSNGLASSRRHLYAIWHRPCGTGRSDSEMNGQCFAALRCSGYLDCAPLTRGPVQNVTGLWDAFVRT